MNVNAEFISEAIKTFKILLKNKSKMAAICDFIGSKFFGIRIRDTYVLLNL